MMLKYPQELLDISKGKLLNVILLSLNSRVVVWTSFKVLVIFKYFYSPRAFIYDFHQLGCLSFEIFVHSFPDLNLISILFLIYFNYLIAYSKFSWNYALGLYSQLISFCSCLFFLNSIDSLFINIFFR